MSPWPPTGFWAKPAAPVSSGLAIPKSAAHSAAPACARPLLGFDRMGSFARLDENSPPNNRAPLRLEIDALAEDSLKAKRALPPPGRCVTEEDENGKTVLAEQRFRPAFREEWELDQ